MSHTIISEPLLVLVGPTAIGKTALSLEMARRHNCEIISVDSMQVYRYLDIGTAKATRAEREAIPHHLIDIVNPDEEYDAVRFAADAHAAITDIIARGKMPLLTGGTGLYLRALLEGIFPGMAADEGVRAELRQRLEREGASKLHEELAAKDPDSAKRVHPNDTQRLLRALEIFHTTGVPWSTHLTSHSEQQGEGRPVQFTNVLQLGLTCPREKLYNRINIRCEQMVASGLEAEVRTLLHQGYHRSLKCFGSIGYRHMINYIDGNWPLEEMIRLLKRDTRRYAKRQYTWFSRLADLHWFDTTEEKEILEKIDQWLQEPTKDGDDKK